MRIYFLLAVLIFLSHTTTAKVSLGFYDEPIEIMMDTTQKEKVDTTADQSKLDDFNKKMEKIVRIFPLPVVSYSAETDWLFGLTKINSFRIGADDQYDESIQPSQVTALFYLTMNKQYKGVLTSDLIFSENKWESFTQIMFIDFPSYYFGIGDDTKLEDRCWVDTENFGIEQSIVYQLNETYYIGVKYLFNNFLKVDTVADAEQCAFNYENLDENEGIQSGIGIRARYDTRDNRLSARKGSAIYFEFMNYGKWIGSEFEYNSLTIDLRKFITPIKGLTLAGQLYSEAKFGNVPIQSLSLMGGDDMMRGVYHGRFRDKTMIEAQVELRFPIFWVFSGAVFTGLGEVAPDFNSYTWDGVKWTYGAGIRLVVNEATRSNLRFDVGVFEKRPLFFFTYSEAF